MNAEKTMPLLDHLKEFRKRLIISVAALVTGAVVSFYFYEPIVRFLFQPFQQIGSPGAAEQKLYIHSLFEGFLTRFKISLIAGVILTLPVHIYHIVRFVFPGLTAKERKVIIGALISGSILLLTGFYYSYYLIIPISVSFLTSTGFIPDNVGLLLNFKTNIFYIFQFLISFVILFQVPVLLVLLMMMNVVQRKALVKVSRYVIVAIFILAAIITPPDFISQVCLGLPLVVLYFLSILIAKIFKLGEG